MGFIGNLGAICTIIAVASIARAHDCGQEELLQCQQSLSELNEFSDLSFLSRKGNLQKQCPDLLNGLECIQSYTRRCMNPDQRAHFNKLYAGTAEMIHQLCEDNQYQEDFLRHAPCLHIVRGEYEECLSKYHHIMAKITEPEEHQKRDEFGLRNSTAIKEDNIRELCCVFKEFIACSEYTVRKTCGKDAAFFTRSLLDKISSSLMRIHCAEFKAEPGKCGTPYYANSSPVGKASVGLLVAGGVSFLLTCLFISYSSIRKWRNASEHEAKPAGRWTDDDRSPRPLLQTV